MKRVLLMVFSIVLILACIFSLFACVAGVRDVLNIKEYKTSDAEFARESLATARDGIAQLKENEEAYLTGVGTYTDGLAQYVQGKSDYAAGQQTLAAGEKTLADGYAAYAAGKKQLEEGKAAYEAGKKQIEENTQAYNEGKEKLAKIEPLLPYLNQYVAFRDGTIGNLPGFDTAQAWFVAVVRPMAKNLGLDIPADVTDFPAYINQMVADGKAQLKQYEDGVAQLAEAEKTIAAGEAQLAAAEKELAAGEEKLASGRQDLAAGAAKLAAAETQLEDGKAQLSVFEQGEIALAEGGMALCEGMPLCFSYFNGRQTVKSLPEYLAGQFGVEIPDNLVVVKNGIASLNTEAYEEFCITVLSAMYKVDENGEVVVKNGFKMLDLDKCSTLCDMAEQYLQDQEADITQEVMARVAIYAALALAAVLGIIAGIRGIVAAAKGSRKTGKVLGIISAALALAAVITGICTHFGDYVYSVRLDEVGNYVTETASKLSFAPIHQYSGTIQLIALVIMACSTVLFAIFAIAASNAAREKEAALAAAAAEDEDEAAYAAAALAAAEAAAESAGEEEPKAEEQVIEAQTEDAPAEETVKE